MALSILPLRSIRIAAIVVGFGILRLQLYRLVVVPNGFVVVRPCRSTQCRDCCRRGHLSGSALSPCRSPQCPRNHALCRLDRNWFVFLFVKSEMAIRSATQCAIGSRLGEDSGSALSPCCSPQWLCRPSLHLVSSLEEVLPQLPCCSRDGFVWVM